MLNISSTGEIELTRGDSAWLEVGINNLTTGEAYSINPDDILTLSIKKSVYDNEPVLQKTIKGSNVFNILPSDTSNLEFLKYKYDVQLTTSSGDVFTVIPPSTFHILQEVTT